MKEIKIYLTAMIILTSLSCDVKKSTTSNEYLLFRKELSDSLPFDLEKFNESIYVPDLADPYVSYHRIDSLGRFVSVTDYERSISGFYFYSSHKDFLGGYKPYPDDFPSARYCFSELDFFLVAFNDESPDSLKMARLKHNGELIKERTIKNPFPPLDWFHDLKISGNNLILVLNNRNIETKIIGLDFDLNDVWQQTIDGFIFYDGVNSNLTNSDLIISDKKQITKYNSKNGEVVWTYTPFKNTKPNKVYKTKLLANNRYVGLFKFKGEERANHEYEYTDCDLTILDMVDGQVKYSENLPNSKSEIILFNNSYPGIGPNEFYMQRNDSIWRYSYLEKTK